MTSDVKHLFRYLLAVCMSLPSSRDDGGVSWVFLSCGPSVGFLTIYDGELREPKSAGHHPKHWAGRMEKESHTKNHLCCDSHSSQSVSRPIKAYKARQGHGRMKPMQGDGPRVHLGQQRRDQTELLRALRTLECLVSPACVTPPELKARSAKRPPARTATSKISGCGG